MKRLSMIYLLLLTALLASAQTRIKAFDFGYYLNLMRYGAKGLTLDDYKKKATDLGLNLIHHSEEKSEMYLVWGQDVNYKKERITESYSRTGEQPRCVNMDLTPNGKNRYAPICITLVFPDQTAQQQFWNDGLKLGCSKNEQIEQTDLDATWTQVQGLKYIANPKTQTSWRYIYFYEKDGLFLSTFLF